MENVPQKIYLQIGDDCPNDVDFNELVGVSWCSDKINDNDIEFMLVPCEGQPDSDTSGGLHLACVSKVKEFICPCCSKMVPITKVIYECECGVKHETQINDETAVCGLHKDAAECKHRNNGKCTFIGSCYFKQTDC